MNTFQTIVTIVVLVHYSQFLEVEGTLLETIGSLLSPNKPSNSKLEYGSYYKGPVCQPSTAIRHPTSISEVIQIVQEAISSGKTVKAIGSRHSATDVICTDGIPIDMTLINQMDMSANNLVVTTGAGANVYSLARFLRGHGRGLRVIPAFGNITVGGAIGTGAHGSSIRFTASISEQVIGLELIDGTGNLRTITDSENVKAFKVHLGLLGIVTRVMLRTVPLYKVMGHNYVASDEILYNGKVAEIARSNDQISVYWFPSYSQVVICNWTIVDVNTPGNARTYDVVPSTSTAFNTLNAPLIETAHATDSIQAFEGFQLYLKSTLLHNTPGYVPIYTEDGSTLENPAVGYYDDMFAPICQSSGDLQCPWLHGPHNVTVTDNEMAIPLELLPQLVPKVKDIVRKYYAIFASKGILMRFSGKTDTYMSMSEGRDTCHFEFFMSSRVNTYDTGSSGLAAYQTILQTIAFEFNGRSHWGKSGSYYHTSESITRKLNPSARQRFVEKMNEFDPNGVFLNAFGKRLKGIGTKINSDPAVRHCALLDNCICSKSSDCAVNHICSTLDGYSQYHSCIIPAHLLTSLTPIITSSLTEDLKVEGSGDDVEQNGER